MKKSVQKCRLAGKVSTRAALKKGCNTCVGFIILTTSTDYQTAITHTSTLLIDSQANTVIAQSYGTEIIMMAMNRNDIASLAIVVFIAFPVSLAFGVLIWKAQGNKREKAEQIEAICATVLSNQTERYRACTAGGLDDACALLWPDNIERFKECRKSGIGNKHLADTIMATPVFRSQTSNQ